MLEVLEEHDLKKLVVSHLGCDVDVWEDLSEGFDLLLWDRRVHLTLLHLIAEHLHQVAAVMLSRNLK